VSDITEPAIERGDSDSYFDYLAAAIEETMDFDQLLEITKTQVLEITASIFDRQPERQEVHIAVAKDAAFNFYPMIGMIPGGVRMQD
jgi:cobyrinic acid a,c-diamide synthase